MPDLSARLGLPYLMPAQAQKHVTHNAALERLDALVQARLDELDATTPPASPPEGALYAVGSGATGDWSGQDGQLAHYQNGGWVFFAPDPGWQAWDGASARPVAHDGSGWSAAAAAGIASDSSAAGEMCRLADGTQMAWISGGLSFDSAARLSATWTFPESYATAAPISVTAQLSAPSGATPGADALGVLVTEVAPDGSAVTLYQYRQGGAADFQPGDSLPFAAMAIGRRG